MDDISDVGCVNIQFSPIKIHSPHSILQCNLQFSSLNSTAMSRNAQHSNKKMPMINGPCKICVDSEPRSMCFHLILFLTSIINYMCSIPADLVATCDSLNNFILTIFRAFFSTQLYSTVYPCLCPLTCKQFVSLLEYFTLCVKYVV